MVYVHGMNSNYEESPYSKWSDKNVLRRGIELWFCQLFFKTLTFLNFYSILSWYLESFDIEVQALRELSFLSG